MKATREDVIKWLKANGRQRIWLAERCNVSKQAVSNWLREKNPQDISASAQLVIGHLMELDEKQAQANPPNHLVMKFDDAEFEQIELMAHKCDKPLRKWAELVLNSVANKSLDEIKSLISSKDTPTKESVKKAVTMIRSLDSPSVKKATARTSV